MLASGHEVVFRYERPRRSRHIGYEPFGDRGADSEQSEQAYTSILNVMELRSVLAKKKAFDRERIDQIEDRIARKMTVTFPDASDIVAANERQAETLLYPMDALILSAAESADCPLVTFDSELLEHGAVEPAEHL